MVSKRNISIVNLDPAALVFDYPSSFDIRDLVTLEDVMKELRLGPNGGLIYCMEYFEDNLEYWFDKEISHYGEDDFLIFDCPGQMELFSHISVFQTLSKHLQSNGWKVGTVYALDSHFILENAKFVAAAIQALSAMALLELGQINLLTKMDLSPVKEQLNKFLCPNILALVSELTDSLGPRFRKMNEELGRLLDDYSLINFSPLDLTCEESLASVMYRMDAHLFSEEEVTISLNSP